MSDMIYSNDAFVPAKVERFFCSTSAALVAGQGVCLNSDYGTATAVDGQRLQVVETPSVTNSRDFVGILVNAKPAHAAGLVAVEVAVGGGCLVYSGESTVTLGDYLTCDVLDGKFYAAGHGGRGTVKVLQTLAAAGLALAQLCDGDQSGLVHTQTPALAGGAIVLTPTGRSRINGATISTAHATWTLANGKFIGERKSIVITNTVGSSKNLVVTVTNGVQIDRTTALASLTFNAANEEAILEWNGMDWALLGYVGVTLA